MSRRSRSVSAAPRKADTNRPSESGIRGFASGTQSKLVKGAYLLTTGFLGFAFLPYVSDYAAQVFTANLPDTKKDAVKAGVHLAIAASLAGCAYQLPPIRGVCNMGAFSCSLLAVYHLRNKVTGADPRIKVGMLGVLAAGMMAVLYYLNRRLDS